MANKVQIGFETTGTRGVGADFDALGNKASSTADRMTNAGRKMTLGVTVPLVAAGAAAFKMASDLDEATSQAEQVFGRNAEAIIEASDDMADSFSQEEFLSMASNLGDIAQGMGFTRDAASTLSTDVLELAQDLGSFKNLPTEQAVNAITTALTGERESLKSLGIVINEAMVQQRAMADRADDVTGALTQQEKAAATLALVTEASANAIGDFDRTADGAANKSRILTANFKDTAATLGQDLIPIGMILLGWASDITAAFGSLSPTMQKVVLVTAGLFAAMGPLLSIGGNVSKMFTSMSNAGLLTARNLGRAGLAGALLVAGVALFKFTRNSGNAAEIQRKAAEQTDEWRRKIDALSATFDDASDRGDEFTAQTAATELANLGLADAFVGAGLTGQGLIDILLTLGANTKMSTQVTQDLLGAYGLLNGMTREQVEGFDDLARATFQARVEAGLIDELVGDLAVTAEGTTAAINRLGVALDTASGDYVASFVVETHQDGPIRRFHSGGVFRSQRPGGEGLAVLQDGETVTPAGRAAVGAPNGSGGVGDVRVTVMMPNGDVLAEAVAEANLGSGGAFQ